MFRAQCSEARVRSDPIDGTAACPCAGEGRDDARGDDDLADEVIVIVRHEERRAVGREGHGAHMLAVRALLLRLQLQGSCRRQGSRQSWAEGSGVSVPTHPHPRL